MDYKIVWSPAAREDLSQMVSYIGQQNPLAGRNFGDKAIELVEQASVFPESGRVVPEFGIPTIRELIHKPYRIVYRVDHKSKVIDIARVWHSQLGTPKI